MKKNYFLVLSFVLIANLSFAQWTTSGSTIYNSNTGYVGIGTSFHLQSSLYTLAGVDNLSTTPFPAGINLVGLTSGDLMLRSYWGVSVDLNDGSQGDNTNGTYTRIPHTTSFTINSRTSSTTFNTLFAVRNNGTVLIGETSPKNTAYLLDVNGSVWATAITVNATGADFVFAPSYKLLTLPELNNFIQKNHHLPEIASAKEMQANGLNVGDNQIKLLQKVEELTLYLIDKDKQLNEQNATINKQQSQIDLQNTKLSQSDMNYKIQSEQLKSQQEQLDQLKTQLSSLLKQQKN